MQNLVKSDPQAIVVTNVAKAINEYYTERGNYPTDIVLHKKYENIKTIAGITVIATNFVDVSDRELRSLCIEFLDSKGIYTVIAPNSNGQCWGYNIIPNNCFGTGLDFRTEATEAGIIKAFEIYNQGGER